jgi:hypothetical protein
MAGDPSLRTFRDTFEALTPRWLKKAYGYAHKLLYTFFVHADAIGDGAIFGARRRFPGYDEYDSLDLTGRDRKIRRGRSETDAVYASRQLRWLTDHATRGNAYALLTQLHAHYAASPLYTSTTDGTYATLMGRNGVRYKLYAEGGIDRDTVVGWDPDGSPPEQWARWWLGIQLEEFASDGIWSDPGTWDDGGVWDSNLTAAEVADIRLIPKEWGNGHSIGYIVLLKEGQVMQDYDGTSTDWITVSVS